MLTVILLAIILVIYIILLITRHKNDKSKITVAVQVVQGIMWTLIAAIHWAGSHIVIKVVYVMIILLSFIAGIRAYFDDK